MKCLCCVQLSTLARLKSPHYLAENCLQSSIYTNMISQDSSFSWMVAICTSIIRMLINSINRVGGLFFVDCIERFQITREKASVPFVIPFVLMTIIGPIIGLLGNRYGLENITSLGCLIASFGIGANFFAKDINMVTLFYGVFYGLGGGLGLTLIPNILHKYFTKRYSSANGLSLAGSSLGAIILPLVAKPLFDSYGGAGSYLLLGAISLNAIPSCLMLKCANNRILEEELIKSKSNSPDPEIITTISSAVAKQSYGTVCNCGANDTERNEVTIESKDIEINVLECGFRCECATGSLVPSQSQLSATENQLSATQDQPSAAQECSETQKQTISTASNREIKTQKRSWENILKTFKILLSLKFIIICFVNGVYLFIFSAFFTIIVDLSLDKHTTLAEGTYIQAILSTTDVVSRLSLGFVTDREHMTLISFMMSSFIAWALVFVIFVWANSFPMLMLASGLYGIVSGGIMIHLPTICVKYVDKKDLVFVMSSRYLWFSPLTIATPLIIGYFRDSVGSYDGLLYLLISLCVLTSILLYSIPYLAEREKIRIPT